MQEFSKMIKLFLGSPFLSFLVLCVVSNCTIGCNEKRPKEFVPQGYVVLKNNVVFDGGDKASQETAVHDSTFPFLRRQMILFDHFLIDIVPRSNYTDGIYEGVDTAEITFYDLRRQKFISFKSLTSDAKVIRKGAMLTDASFSNAIEHDPLANIPDSFLTQKMIKVNGKDHILVGLIPVDSASAEYSRQVKFWIDPSTNQFPLQLSYKLSRSRSNGFVYKRQLPFPEGNKVMITEFEYQEKTLPENLRSLFSVWAIRIDE